MTRHLDVRAGSYHDSVALMRVSQQANREAGVRAALVAMATPLNLDLLAGMGFTVPAGAAPNDLLVAIDAENDDALARSLSVVEAALTERAAAPASGFGDAPAARTVGTAVDRSNANIAFISTPGDYAFADAMDALDGGVSVIVFSDNVPLEQEVRLKREAGQRGLLVMGPDCGTAMINGVGFGFANVVRPGPVGLVAASGTGAQQLMCLIDGAGVGISHCLGVGGRDLSAAVGAMSTLTALDALAGDSATELIVVVSKPPAAEIAQVVRSHAAELGKPVQFAFLDEGEPDLTAVAGAAVEALGHTWTEPRSWPMAASSWQDDERRYVRGLFSGGTLCDEAMVIAAGDLGPIRSNVPLRPEWALPDGLRGGGHIMIDFGDDALTRGRPHPMIDGSLRVERLLAEADDPSCGVIMLDVVLGYGAHPDPAAELAPAIAQARKRATGDGRELDVVVSLIGTADDHQGLERQARALNEAGASVYLSNAAAARHAVELAGGYV